MSLPTVMPVIELPAPAPAETFAGRTYPRLVEQAFARALQANARRENYFYRIGDCTIRMRFAGDALQPVILPALAHLACAETASTDLTIDLADGFSAGVNLPFPENAPNSAAEFPTWRHEEGDVSLLIQSAGDGALSMVNVEEKRGWFWTQNAARLPWYEASFPLRLLLHQWFRSRGQSLVHAAAVGTSAGAALIVGKGGSGKSTTALAGADAGLFYLGDDYTLASDKPEPRVWSLYSSAKASTETLNRLPNLAPFIQRHGAGVEKSLLVFPRDSIRIVSDLPLRAVVWPRVVPRAESRLVPASAATLLLALAPSAILQMPGAGAAEFAALAKLVRSVPTYVLEAGSNLTELAVTLKELLSPP